MGRVRAASAASGAVLAAAGWQVFNASNNSRWYAGLSKPTFTPPLWFVAAAVIALTVALISALYRVLRSPDYLPDRPSAIRWIAAGLVLDAVWSWLFFAGRHPSVALVAAALLAIAAAASSWTFAAVDRRAGLLLLPWLAGALFLVIFDLSITLKNG